MIIVETSLKSIEREVAILEALQDDTDFAHGAIMALQWVAEGKVLPSIYLQLIQQDNRNPQ